MKNERKELQGSEDKKTGIGAVEIIMMLIVLIILVLICKPQIQMFVALLFEKYYQGV